MTTTDFLINHPHEETSDPVFFFVFFYCSHVFSTHCHLSLAAFNHHFIEGFLWFKVALIFSTSAAQRKVCWAPFRVVYRGKVSHVLSGVSLQMMTVGSAEPQSPNEILMRGSQGELGVVTAESAAAVRCLKMLPRRPTGRKRSNSKKGQF